VAPDLPRAFRRSCDVAKRARKFWDFAPKGHRRKRGGLSVFRNPLHETTNFRPILGKLTAGLAESLSRQKLLVSPSPRAKLPPIRPWQPSHHLWRA
jgi:hypothetical protein